MLQSRKCKEVWHMANYCEVCGKKTATGFNVSHSHLKTKRTWKPNIQRVRVLVDGQVKGAFNCIQAALPDMVHEKSGKIINVSSMWGVCGASCEVHYSAAKSALIGLTKALARELAPSNIQVNCIAPGVIDTKMNASLGEETLELLKEESPMGRFGTPEEVAHLMLFLAGDGSDFITGQTIGIDGAFI